MGKVCSDLTRMEKNNISNKDAKQLRKNEKGFL
jgi:hypothetical protein